MDFKKTMGAFESRIFCAKHVFPIRLHQMSIEVSFLRFFIFLESWNMLQNLIFQPLFYNSSKYELHNLLYESILRKKMSHLYKTIYDTFTSTVKFNLSVQ